MTKHLTQKIFDSRTRSGIRQEFRYVNLAATSDETLGEFRYMSVAKGPETLGEFRYMSVAKGPEILGEFRYGVMSKRSSGTTILEVLFAIMVVIVGLLGIASIIPLAARNANESNTHNNAQSLGPSWLHAFTSRGLNVSNSFERSEQGYNWVWLRDYPGNVETFQRFRKSYAAALPAEAAAVGVTGTLNQSPSNAAVTAGAIVRNWGYQSVCIDPYFFTDTDVRQRVSSTSLSSRVGAFRAAVFPYYEDGYNPLSDSAQPADPWQDQPRMIRVGLSNNNATNALVASKLINDIFASTDDLSMSTYNVDPATGERIKDDSIPAMRLFQTTTVSGNTIPLGASPASEYSWIITASPREPLEVPTDIATVNATTDDYTVSLVVMHRRDSLYIPSTITPVPGEKEDKPQGERLVWVAPISGSFMNGNGGRVRLMANEFTDDTVRIGDWIMLGRQFLVNPAIQDQRYSYYRWYRIVAVDQESRHDALGNLSPSTDPYGNSASQMVWSRDVVLEGPDFNFASAVGGVLTPTTGTLVSGVVTVLERKISIE